jgi:hypothetical protein
MRAGVERSGQRLELSFGLVGDMTRIRLPGESGRQRTEALWQHTCFEAFLKAPGHEDYLEFNFAPFGPWAAYRFDGYRSGRRNLRVAAPTIGGWTGPDMLNLFVALDLPPRAWDIGFSAVIENSKGRISYWALAHPSAKPDFHHPDSFALQFPGPST